MTRAQHGTWALAAWVGILFVTAVAARAGPVDNARLEAAQADPDNWLTFGHDYTNQRFSGLDGINRDTIGGLTPRWIHQTGITGTFQTHPLVADGMMVITTPRNHVTALDAKSGAVLWRYIHKKRIPKTRSGPSNRGPALGYGKVFQATNDGRLIALDRKTGTLVWDSLLAVPAAGELDNLAGEARSAFAAGVNSFPAKMAPLVAEGLVIAGVISAGYGLYYDATEYLGIAGPAEVERKQGRRGYLAAFDAETGVEKWRWHTTKSDGWEGDFRATTPDGVALNRDIEGEKSAADAHRQSWRAGGGSAWMTPAYDPALGLIFLGTGNPSPADVQSLRPGDNLYTSSLVALDVKTGKIRWHYQIVPHDIWGYDTASPPILFNLPTETEPRAVVGVASKNGWFYVLDRVSGELVFKSEAFVPQKNLFARPTAAGVDVLPGSFGGASWSPGSYDPGTGYVIIPAIHRSTTLAEQTLTDEKTGRSITYVATKFADDKGAGTLTAIDTRAGGKIAWQVKTEQPLVGGVLATAGGLVFAGEGDGNFSAFDSATGKRLWRFNCGAGVNAPPMAYQVDDVQYVAVAAGGSRVFKFPVGDAVISFALGATK